MGNTRTDANDTMEIKGDYVRRHENQSKKIPEKVTEDIIFFFFWGGVVAKEKRLIHKAIQQANGKGIKIRPVIFLLSCNFFQYYLMLLSVFTKEEKRRKQ